MFSVYVESVVDYSLSNAAKLDRDFKGGDALSRYSVFVDIVPEFPDFSFLSQDHEVRQFLSTSEPSYPICYEGVF